MKSRLFLVSATAILVAAFAWTGCSSDDSEDGPGAAGAAGSGKGGADGGVNKGGSNQGGAENKGGANQGGTNQGGTNQGGSEQGGANQGGANQGGSAQGGAAGGGTVPPLPQGCLTDNTIGYACNPMTNDGCDSAAGAACDYGENGFECFDPPNDVPVGGDCNNQGGPYCEAKLHCDGEGKCAPWCCADSDCTGGKKCIALDETMGTLGMCGEPPPPPADAGTPCTKAEECGDTDVMICDPAGTGCQSAQCDGTTDCAAGKVCLGQVSSPTIGACYTECTAFPTATGCGAQETCVSSFGQTKGACRKFGTGADGAACTPVDDVSTGCVAGLVCAEEGAASKCRAPCDPFGTPACGAGLVCDTINSACVGNAEAVAIDAACTGDDFTPCGVENGVAKGFCGAGTCIKWCRPNQAGDCPTGTACTGTVGIDSIMMYCE